VEFGANYPPLSPITHVLVRKSEKKTHSLLSPPSFLPAHSGRASPALRAWFTVAGWAALS
jgi:hypothetical protein